MILTLKLDIKNAINHNQAVEILKREPWYGQLERGVLKEKGWRNATNEEVKEENKFRASIGDDELDTYVIRDESKDVYEEPFIKVIEIKEPS